MSRTGESSAEVQRKAERERAELVNTLDRLRENLKPANVVDEVMASAKVSTAEISDRLWQVAKNNPVPSAIIGIGAAMLLGVGRIAGRSSVKESRWTYNGDAGLDESDFAGDDLREFPESSRLPGKSLADRASSAATRIGSGLKSSGSQVAASASHVAGSAIALKDQVSDKFAGYMSSAREGSDLTDEDADMARYVRSRDSLGNTMSRLLDEQPLVLAALGVAVGAAIGAAIPSTEAEARLMGDASGTLKNRAQELAQEQYAHIKETASATLEDLKQQAADRGVSTDNISGLVQDAGARVRDAAYDVAGHAAEKSGLNDPDR